MKLSRSFAAAAVFAMLAVSPAAAFAQEPPPLAVTASEGTCGATTLTATAAAGTYTIAVYSGPNAGGQIESLGMFDSTADGAAKTFTLDEDAYDGDGFVSWATVAGPEQDFYVHGAIAVKTDCAPPADDTTPPADDGGTTPPADADGDTPAGEPLVATPADEKNCEDFITQDDAQAVYNADLSDPNKLDDDGDGIACELLVPAAGGPAPAATTDGATDGTTGGGDFGQVGSGDVPVGGVETGGGPAA
ncbi:excalibur calcium-binding domain-containing protein [Pseudonocardia parietis]|uniref:Excalibur calcium-binding domain-containing protein n=1 Tax=Pseudonocardia parietis TaxID=570936 RepID=A0ABS4W1W8_9PSEU|nr:excalibur calcium-binding domain-containing protein [Pseudonocardia parietis]MBP2370205.1 hypothetical protein [Pseudonocardia parietis]